MENTRPMLAAADAEERFIQSKRLWHMLEAPEEGSEEEGEERRLRAELEEESRLRAELKVERRRARAVGLAWALGHDFLTRPRLITWHTLPHPAQFWVRNSAGDEIEVEGWARARPRLDAATDGTCISRGEEHVRG